MSDSRANWGRTKRLPVILSKGFLELMVLGKSMDDPCLAQVLQNLVLVGGVIPQKTIAVEAWNWFIFPLIGRT